MVGGERVVADLSTRPRAVARGASRTRRCAGGQRGELPPYSGGKDGRTEGRKAFSQRAGWSTLYHSNSGQGNRGMMREREREEKRREERN